ncbi:MAG: hypothetical protein D3923_11180, partial [Candidatus Electrothrix sp. AR3]|nr:hypothetical protein [Candidatus Electrothrix sp. AR3]
VRCGLEQLSTNDGSLVLRYQHGRRAFLFPGDIENKSEALLLRQGTEVSADVLLAAHHGSITSTGKDFLTAVAPQLIVVSAGKYGQRHYPAPENFSIWQELGIPVHITRDQGTMTCMTDGEELECLGYNLNIASEPKFLFRH